MSVAHPVFDGYWLKVYCSLTLFSLVNNGFSQFETDNMLDLNGVGTGTPSFYACSVLT